MRILIVEDDILSSRCLEILAKEFLNERIQSIHAVSDPESAAEFIRKNPLDLLFLDINLQGETGFKLLEIESRSFFQTIIVSSERDNAVKAFEFSVLDFLPKPITRERFGISIHRYLSSHPNVFSPKGIPHKKEEAIEPDNIVFARSERNYARLFTKDGSVEKVRKTLDQLQKDLEAHGFFRAHRSYLVRLEEVKKILFKTPTTYRLLLHSDHSIPVSRSQGSKLLSLFKNSNHKVLGLP
ncbi:DNA-binding response regulator [Leptospira hartskeerlii]|uniref:DNA-binding response regulator n=1 Tax=Leptospira hartskeerlii TaxID=2023177 RepID=A0A2M9XDW7_9LEPT|nr:LytTR family DNA-binding domain-containing protein [Leptospira hartskeerlii]PJZ25772.1 DNA-binding response regulator [Leptospira hartskeerlii]PJZ35405.1 DNA-binding response regulator [Leptospira hartskeerlii]